MDSVARVQQRLLMSCVTDVQALVLVPVETEPTRAPCNRKERGSR
jgi:hypothetical protein